MKDENDPDEARAGAQEKWRGGAPQDGTVIGRILRDEPDTKKAVALLGNGPSSKRVSTADLVRLGRIARFFRRGMLLDGESMLGFVSDAGGENAAASANRTF